MGSPDYATTILQELLNSHYKVVALFTQEDKPAGRGRKLTPPHIKGYVNANNINIPIFQPISLKNDEVVQQIKELQADFIIVAAYGKLLPKNILDIAPCINLHASILPSYRGASPIQYAILNGDSFGGVTAMRMAKGMDTGDMLAYSFLKLDNFTTLEYLFKNLSNLAAQLTITTLDNFDNIKPIKQVHALCSNVKKITKQTGLVDFECARTLDSKFPALTPWPGIFLENKTKLKNIEIIETSSNNKAGIILNIEKDFIDIGCNSGSIRIHEIQPPSKKAVSGADFARGKRLNQQDILKDL